MHLLYARFWTKALADAGLLHFREPFPRLRSQGIVHAADGKRMSKSRGNVVTPDEVVARYGADILRIHLLFMAPFERNVNWDEEGIAGAERFLQRVWRLCLGAGKQPRIRAEGEGSTEDLRRATHKTVQRVTQDIEAFKFNTAVAAMMEFANTLWANWEQHGANPVFQEAADVLIRLLAPFAPHIAEELWMRRGGEFSVHQQTWPDYDPALVVDDTITMVVQVNGKVRDRIIVSAEIGDEGARQQALASARVQRYLGGKVPKKLIVASGQQRLGTIVVSVVV
jgi:leucyl-tRNA synthetase